MVSPFLTNINLMWHNVFVYEKLRVCVRGFSAGKSEASKRATNFVPTKTSNFLYTVLPFRCFFSYSFWQSFFCVSLISPTQHLRTALVSQMFFEFLFRKQAKSPTKLGFQFSIKVNG